MRLSSLLSLLGAAVLVTAGDEKEPGPTVFNGISVPPMLELTPKNFNKEIVGTKWMLVKHYSPQCPHCISFAPTFQTLYEFYYTSEPDFTKYSSLRFASMNCVAYYDLCAENGVETYPTITMYKDGKVFETLKGARNMTVLSALVEKVLSLEHPGTRPTEDIILPTPGAKTGTKIVHFADDPPKAEPSSKAEPSADASAAAAKAKSTKTTQPGGHHAAAAKKPPKSTAVPNPLGLSVALTAETFHTEVTVTQDPWFIKFYAPWCHHCQAMASNWQQLAKEMKGRLNIGEVNCDVESRLCKDVRLHGYPTILFFRGGERVEYEGLRGLGDFVQYAERAIEISNGVQDVDLATFKALEKEEDVIFVYFYDHATTSEDFTALERLPLSLIGHARLVKTRDPAMYQRFKITTWPRLLVSREGRPTYYTPLTPKEMRDVPAILAWMRSVWLPIVPELTASNAREIMDGKIVVLGILNREDQEAFTSAKREMKSAAFEWMDKQIQAFQLERQELRDAKQLRIEEAEDRGDQRALRAAKSIRINMDKSDRKEVAFAWVDGVFWQRWIRTTYGIDVKDGERIIINDEDNRRYWDTTSTGNYILPSRTSILETVSKVVVSPPKIKPKLTISSIEKMFLDMRITFSEHPFLTLGCIAGIAFGVTSWFRGRLRRTRGGHFRVGDDHHPHRHGSGSLGIKEFKESLLGGGVAANGKVD